MLIYLLQVTLCWGFFALFYGLLLHKETFFRANRLYLLTTGAAGLLLPLSIWWFPAAQNEMDAPVFVLPVFTAGLQQMEQAVIIRSWGAALKAVYWLGFILAFVRLLWGISRLAGMILRSRAERLSDGVLIVRAERVHLPFSFFHWIFVPQDVENRNGFQNMLEHERAHARGRHSIDVLLMELLCVVLWFHPLAHWYRNALRKVHEYLADAAASRTTDRRQYGLLLVRQVQGKMPVVFANHFFQSPLKQRIVMLTKESSAPVYAWKYLLTLPSAVFLFLFFQQIQSLTQTIPPKPTQFINTDNSGHLVYKTCEKLPEFPGGMEALTTFLKENLVYPETDRKAGRVGQIGVSFVVNTTGGIEQITTEVYGGSPSPEMLEEAIRIVNLLPRWQPAEHGGKKVKCRLSLPVRFSLQ